MSNSNTINNALYSFLSDYQAQLKVVDDKSARLNTASVQLENIRRKIEHLVATNKPSFLINQSQPDRLCFFMGKNTIVFIENDLPIDIQIFTNTEFVDLSKQPNEVKKL